MPPTNIRDIFSKKFTGAEIWFHIFTPVHKSKRLEFCILVLGFLLIPLAAYLVLYPWISADLMERALAGEVANLFQISLIKFASKSNILTGKM